jgi:hypothetical protein
MKRRAPLVLAGLLAAIALTPRHVNAAEGVKEAKAHAERALRQYNLGNFDEAIAEFSKAYDIAPSPVLLYNIALAHQQAGNAERAVFFYRRYLVEAAPGAPNRDEASRRVHELEDKIAKQSQASEKAPASATPGPPPGSSAPAAAIPPQPQTSSANAVTPPPQPGTTGVSAKPGISTPPSDVPPTAGTGAPWTRTLTWVAGGAAVVALGAGVGFHLAASGKFSDFDRSCALQPGTNQPVHDPAASPVLSDSQCSSLYNDWTSDKHWAIAGYVAGGALAVTSVILFATSRQEPSTAGRHAFLQCSPGPGTFFCQGTF